MNTKFLITSLIAGALMGLAFAGTDLFNPRTSEAEVNRRNMETAHQQAVYELQERLSAAQTESEINNIQREQDMLDAQYEHDKLILAQDAANKQRMADITINLVSFVGAAIGISTAIGMILIAAAKAITILLVAPKKQSATAPPPPMPTMKVVASAPSPAPYDPLYPPSSLFEKRLDERLKEIAAQRGEDVDLLIARMKTFSSSAQMSKKEYRKHPLAGD